MSPQQLEYLRLALLRVLDANQTRFGLGTVAVGSLVSLYGFASAPPETDTELRYLADKGLVRREYKAISPENHAWRITAAGRDFLAEYGL